MDKEPIEFFVVNNMLQALYELKEEKPENVKSRIEQYIIFYENIISKYDNYLNTQ